MTVDQIREKYYTLKGKEEGAYQKAIENARNFLKLGVSPEIVAQGTGLSMKEIQKIKDELNN